MSYVTGNLNLISQGTLESDLVEWAYKTTDDILTVTASGYISDATKKGMKVGHIVWVLNNTNISGFLTQVQSIASGAATLAAMAGTGGLGLANFRNLIDGGDFTVNPFQRGTSQASDITNTVTYGPDRFAFKGGASSAINWSKFADTTVAGFSNSLKFQRKSANADLTALSMIQVLETSDSIRAQGQPVALSFYVRSGANYSGGALTAKVISGTGTDDTAANALTASWTGQVNVLSVTQAITGTMTRYQFTGTVPAACKQLAVQFTWTPTGTAGSDDSIIINGIQLEIGSQATVFEHRDVQVELEICQRYFFQTNEPAANVIVATGSVSASNTELFYLALPVQMRAAPTVTVTVGTFKVNSSTGGVVAATGLTGNATHTANAIGLTSTGTGTAGQAAMLQGGGGTGLIAASADY